MTEWERDGEKERGRNGGGWARREAGSDGLSGQRANFRAGAIFPFFRRRAAPRWRVI